MPCHAMPCHAMPCHAMPCHAMPCHAMPCHAMPCHAMPCHAMPCHAMPCHAMPCHAMPCHAMPCHAMPCHAMPCHAMPCHAMPCHAMPCQTSRPHTTRPIQCDLIERFSHAFIIQIIDCALKTAVMKTEEWDARILQYVITFNVTFDIVLLRKDLGRFLCKKIGRVSIARENDAGAVGGRMSIYSKLTYRTLFFCRNNRTVPK